MVTVIYNSNFADIAGEDVEIIVGEVEIGDDVEIVVGRVEMRLVEKVTREARGDFNSYS